MKLLHKKPYKPVLLFIFMLVHFVSSFAQKGFITGRVVDSASHEPLAFVSIVYNASGRGVVTNLDGIFRIPSGQSVQFFKLRYIGYRELTISYSPSAYRNNMVIEMSPLPVEIGEVVVYPAENPAHRIIKAATDHRNENNPERSGPFSYISYDKMVFGVDVDSVKSMYENDSAGTLPTIPDSVEYGLQRENKIDVQRFIDRQYLFMMEAITSRKYISQDKNKEEVIASKVSGISQPSFAIMARQFQSFSFYENFITIANRQLLNPISDGSTSRYFFQIQDTVFTTTNDTVFIITFRPGKGKNFEGMKGVLYINSNGYAIQNVLAEAYEQGSDMFRVSIQQQYEFINNQRWFPVELNTKIIFNPAGFSTQVPPVPVVGTGKTYIMNISFDPVFKAGEFSDVQIAIDANAHRQPEEMWNTYRTDSLTAREMETYRVIDSLGKAEHFDRTVNSFETILTGYLPGNYWMFDLTRFVNYNKYEGLALGAGGRTTDNIARWFRFDGYFSYGLRDKAFKYKAGITFMLWPKYETELGISYTNDIREAGGIFFNEPWSLSGSAFIRRYMISVMDKVKETEVWFGFRSFKYLTSTFYMDQTIMVPTYDYGYRLNNDYPALLLSIFYINEAGIRLRFAFGETFMKTPRGNKFSTGTKYPVLNVNIARGTSWLNGEFNYLKSEAKLTKVFHTKSIGDTKVALVAGMVTGDVPYGKLYVGQGSYRTIAIETEQSFGTMRFNEFLSDRFMTLFIKHDFGTLLFKPSGKFRPEIVLVHNMGFGSLKKADIHENIVYKTLDKGYYESGLLLNNIFRLSYLRYGIGALYRYGPYAYNKVIDNFAFKITLQLKM